MLQKNPELTIPLNNPFQNDKLERDKVADNLTLLVESTTQPFVISVQAPSGWGKTTFIKMWKTQLESLGHICFYFNAWENDFVNDPLIAFVGEINKVTLDKGPISQWNTQLKQLQNFGGKIVRRALPLTIQIATQGLLGQEAVKQASTLLFASGGEIANFASQLAEENIRQYENDKNGIREFRHELKQFMKSLSAGQGKRPPVVFFIDELDRCRPDFTIRLLERIKQIFSVEGIVFVLGVDRAQLEQAIKSVHGEGIDRDGYLRRFVDYTVNLPEPTVEKYVTFLFERFKLKEVFTKRRSGREESESLTRAFVSLAKTYHFSLRVIEQCFTEINLALRTTPMNERVFPFLLALVIALKVEKPASYNLLLASLSAADLTALVSTLKQELDLKDRIHKWTLSQFEAYLISGLLEDPTQRAEALGALKTSAVSQNPIERSYAQQTLRFVEQIQIDGSANAIKDLVSRLSLLQRLTVA
ncbi:MAG TPA: P-loop NTPase fold protein [Anaerolineales bacterium]|nr:P-loop NTPase fold protein [Anaerolineales bacterium]